MKFRFLLDENVAETVVGLMQTADKEHNPNKTQVYEWFSWFNKRVIWLLEISHSTARNVDNIDKIRILMED